MSLVLKSLAFVAGGLIPPQFTCDGEGISPPLAWEGAPAGVGSFALVMDDPDAPRGTWDHWIVFNIPPEIMGFDEAQKRFDKAIQFGKNSWGREDYGGPCPPDKEHTYVFKLYALDQMLPLKTGATKEELEASMKGHVLEFTELKARYDRPRP